MAVPIIQSESKQTGSGSSAVITAPSGIADDDILVIIGSWDGDAAAPTCTGFTSLTQRAESTVEQYVLWKRASSESGNYTVNWTGSEGVSFVMYRVSGCKTTGSPFHLEGTGNTGSGTTTTALGLTTTTNDCLAIAAHSVDRGRTDTTATIGGTGWTIEGVGSALGGSGDASLVVGTKDMASQGATSNCTMSDTGWSTADGWVSNMYVLEPSASTEYSKTFTTDVTLKALDTQKTFTVDTRLVTQGTKTFTADTTLTKIDTEKTFTIDTGLTKLDNPITFTIDTSLVSTISKQFTIDSTLKNTDTQKTFTTDVTLKALDTQKTFTVDTILEGSADFSMDTVLQANDQSKTFTMDAFTKHSTIISQHKPVKQVMYALGEFFVSAKVSVPTSIYVNAIYQVDIEYPIKSRIMTGSTSLAYGFLGLDEEMYLGGGVTYHDELTFSGSIIHKNVNERLDRLHKNLTNLAKLNQLDD